MVIKLTKAGRIFFLIITMIIISVKNACGFTPCQNNAICQAGYTDKGYRCVCAAGFTGQDCTEGKTVAEILMFWMVF